MSKKKSPRTSSKKKSRRRPTVKPGKLEGQAFNLKDLPKETTHPLPLMWVDMADVSVRGDIDMATVRFYSAVVDKMVEACRLQMSVGHLKRFATVVCQNLDFYPERPTE